MKAAEVTVLDMQSVDTEAVFEKYFGKAPPFGDGKSKNEFPDAFSSPPFTIGVLISASVPM